MIMPVKKGLELKEKHPDIFVIFIWRLIPKKKDKYGTYYSTRMSLLCMN